MQLRGIPSAHRTMTKLAARRRSINRIRRIAVAAALALIGGLALAAPAAAEGAVGTVPGRVGGSMSALIALTGAIAGGLAVRRSGRGIAAVNVRDGAVVALVLGVVGVFLAAVHLATSNGGVGTGSGKAGAVVGAVLGLIGVALGRTALVRSRRAPSP